MALTEARKAQLGDYLSSIEADLRVAAGNGMVKEALLEFDRAWGEMGDNPTEILQDLYINDNPHPLGEKHKLDAASDGSPYSQAHARFHPWFRDFLEERGYYDIFLFDLQGDLVYTVFKELDYATNLMHDEWKDTDLGNAFRAARDNPTKGFISFFDFEPYAPSHGAPASFISTPLLDADGTLIGVIVFQMPIGQINGIMSATAGMGESGETYIAGADLLMRSDSRFSEESTILERKIDTHSVAAALAGESGVDAISDYRGVEVESAYAPLEFHGTTWAIIGEIDKDEILAPVTEMRNGVLFGAIVTLLIVGFLGTLISRTITRPIGSMTDAMQRIAAGDDTAQADVGQRSDEIGSMNKALEDLRVTVADAFRLGQMVEEMPTAVMTVGIDDFKINYLNKESHAVLKKLEHHLPAKVEEILGTSIDMFHKSPEHQHKMLEDPGTLPHHAVISLGDEKLDINVSAIRDKSGKYIGPMLNMTIVTDQINLAGQVKEVVELVAASSTQMENTAQSMTTSAELANKQTAAAASGVEETSGNVQTVASASEELSSSIAEVSRQVAESASVAKTAVEEAERTNTQVTGLVESAQRIGDVVKLISEIAEQTNLLALNATIEAARAGDAGKGFAVVANEVKSLANQTAKATEEISSQVAAIQGATSDAATAIKGIAETILKVDEISTSIATVVEEQGTATQEIARSAQKAAEGTHDVTDNMSKVSGSVSETGTAAAEVLEAARGLAGHANKMSDQVDAFMRSLNAA